MTDSPALLILLLALPLMACAHGSGYPATRRDATADTFFGIKVPDPYRWLEDDGSKLTAAWVKAQNEVTFAHLSGLAGREALRQRMTELWNYPRRLAPVREAGKLFFVHNTGLQRQAVLYVQDSLDSEPRVLLDPNLLSPDGSLALSSWSIAPTGKHLAYGLSPGGSDWVELHVRDLETGKDLPDKVQWVKWSDAAWTQDGKGFFYSRYPEPPPGKELQTTLRDPRVLYHLVGQPQSADRFIFALPQKPEWGISPSITEDGRYLLLSSSDETSRNNLDFADLGDPLHPDLAAKILPLATEKDAFYGPLGNLETTLFVHTNHRAPRRSVVSIDLAHPTPGSWKTVIPEAEQSLESAALAGGQLVAHYLVDAKSRVQLFSADGKPLAELALPGPGTVEQLSARADTKELFYSFASFLLPRRIVRRDLTTGVDKPFFVPKGAFAAEGYETRQEFYSSKDGTRIPVFITARKGLSGPRPTILYGYGGFNISITPWFDPMVAAWLELGGVYALANIRGGAEYGEAWHQAGMLDKKQNVFDDFIAAAEHLVRTKVTSHEQLAILGGSNGGLLVGAAMTQRPDLFAVALPEVGVLDMLRYHKFSAGSFWTTEYGSSDQEESFHFLLAYSPLHNVKVGTCYPATLAITADHDDRVVPAHSFKFVAALQAAQACERPVLIRVETEASHGYRPTDKQIAQAADILAFTAHHLGLEVP